MSETQITINGQTLFMIIAGVVFVVVILRYGRAIVRVLSAIGGLLFLILAVAIAALVLGIWTPEVSLFKILEVLR